MSNIHVASAVSDLNAAYELSSNGSPLKAAIGELLAPLAFSMHITNIEDLVWRTSLISLEKFAKNLSTYLTHHRFADPKSNENLGALHRSVLQQSSSLESVGFLHSFYPSFPTAVTLSTTITCLVPEIQLMNRSLQSTHEAQSMMPDLKSVLHSVHSFYTCLEHVLLSPPLSACPASAVRKAASLYNISRCTQLSSSATSVSTDLTRLAMLLRAKEVFFDKLEKSAGMQPLQKQNLTRFVTTMLDSPFIPSTSLPTMFKANQRILNGDSELRNSDVDEHLYTSSRRSAMFNVTNVDRQRIFTTCVVYKPFRITDVHRGLYTQFTDAVYRLRALEHPCIVSLLGAHWPLPPPNRPSSSDAQSQPTRALIATERMTTNVITALVSGCLPSRRTRVQILSDILSAIVSLHEAGVRHSALNVRTVYLRVHDGLLHGRAKLDLPPLVDAAIAPPRVSQMSTSELMFRPPESLDSNSPEYLTGDVWSFGILACFLLSNFEKTTGFEEECALLFLRDGASGLANRLLKDVKDPNAIMALSSCFHPNPIARITSVELTKRLEPLFSQWGYFEPPTLLNNEAPASAPKLPVHNEVPLSFVGNTSVGRNSQRPNYSVRPKSSPELMDLNQTLPAPCVSPNATTNVMLKVARRQNVTSTAAPVPLFMGGPSTSPNVTANRKNSKATGGNVASITEPASAFMGAPTAPPCAVMNLMPDSAPRQHVSSCVSPFTPFMVGSGAPQGAIANGTKSTTPGRNVPSITDPVPAFTGAPNAPPSSTTNIMPKIEPMAYVKSRVSPVAPFMSVARAPQGTIVNGTNSTASGRNVASSAEPAPGFTGAPSAPSSSTTNIMPKIAPMAYVKSCVSPVAPFMGMASAPQGTISNDTNNNVRCRNVASGVAPVLPFTGVPNAPPGVPHAPSGVPNAPLGTAANGSGSIAPREDVDSIAAPAPPLMDASSAHRSMSANGINNIRSGGNAASDALQIKACIQQQAVGSKMAFTSSDASAATNERVRAAIDKLDPSPTSLQQDSHESDNSFEQKLRCIASRGWNRAANEVQMAQRNRMKMTSPVSQGNHEENAISVDALKVAGVEVVPHRALSEDIMEGVNGPSTMNKDAPEPDARLSKVLQGPTDKTISKQLEKGRKKILSREVSPEFIPDLDASDTKESIPELRKRDESPENEGKVWQGRTRQQKKRASYVYPSSEEESSFSEDNDDSSEVVLLPCIDDKEITELSEGQIRRPNTIVSNEDSADLSDDVKGAGGGGLKRLSQGVVASPKTAKKRRRSSSLMSGGSAVASQDCSVGKEVIPNVLKKEVNNGLSSSENGTGVLKEGMYSQGCKALELGMKCANPGVGRDPDYSAAISYFDTAITCGNMDAKVQLGRLLENGLGVAKDGARACNLYFEAAKANHARAFFDAGRCFADGIGTEKDLVTALDYFLRAADTGNADAMMRAGKMYENGEGVKHNQQSAFQLYKQAANAGNVEGKVKVASCFAKGDGVRRQMSKAVEAYREASALGDPSAMLSLGLLHEDGNGVRKNCEQALKYYRKSASLGHGPGITALGQCYVWAYGVTGDYRVARDLFLASAKTGHSLAFHELGMLYKEGNGVEKNMETAVQYFRDASDRGSEVAMVQMGDCLYHGNGVKKNLKAAFKMFRRAADCGTAEGYRWVGDCYADGSGVRKDVRRALENYRRGADLGSATARTSLGSCYENGIGVAVNMAKALGMYRKAAECGDPTAQNNLGILYENGKHVKKDYVKAVAHYRKAIELGSTEAMCNLADSFANGHGVTKCMITAIKWYSEGAKHGIASAQCDLGVCYSEGKGVPRDVKRAVELFEQASGRDTEAKRHLGRAYCDGVGVECDVDKGTRLLIDAADVGGNTDACYDVGLAYDRGFGVEKNEEKAMQYYERAAEAGNKLAMAALGNMCFKKEQHPEAAKWYMAMASVPNEDKPEEG